MRFSSPLSPLALIATTLFIDHKSDVAYARKDPLPSAISLDDNVVSSSSGNNNGGGERSYNSNSNGNNNKINLLIKYKNSQSKSFYRTIDAINNVNTANNSNLRNKKSKSKISVVSNIPSSSKRSIASSNSIATVEIDEQDKELILEELSMDANILLVEEDYPMYKFPFTRIKDAPLSTMPQQEKIEESLHSLDEDLQQLQQQYYLQEELEDLVEQELMQSGLELNSNHSMHHKHRILLGENQQYGVDLIQAPQVWKAAENTNRTISPVKVCIIDTGYDYTHEDLPKESVTTTETRYGSALVDGDGHGTHCAGVIGAIGGNGVGVVGVNPDPTKFSFHISKALSDQGLGTASTVIEAIEGCISSGSKIISMSLGGGPSSAIARETFEDAYNDGVLVFAAAGNLGSSNKDYPASYPHVISVGAVDQTSKRAPWSNYNDQVELMGPGKRIKSTFKDNSYHTLSGTSMATPYVAGVAALVWGYFPECSNHQIRNVLAVTAKTSSNCDSENGFGLVQAKAAFDLLDEYGCAAGGKDTSPLSLGGIGGCGQPVVDAGSLSMVDGATQSKVDSTGYLPILTGSEECDKLEIEVFTDTHALEISWIVERLEDSGPVLVASKPPYGSNYKDDTLYSEATDCLVPGNYVFTISDVFGDGINEPGYYSITLNSLVLAGGSHFGSSESTQFTVGLPFDARQPESDGTWVELLDENFSNGFGSFIDGGNDVIHLSEAYGRSGVVRINDGNRRQSLVYSKALTMKQYYAKFKVVFSFYASGMEEGDKLCIDYSNNSGSAWRKAECLVSGPDFDNGIWIDGFSVLFEALGVSSNIIQIRLRCKTQAGSGSIIVDRIHLVGESEPTR